MNEPRNELVPRPPSQPPPVGSTASGGITVARKVVALLVAALSDAISVGAEFIPPLQIVVDVVTALVLFSVLGFRWPLLPVLIIEAIPGVAAFPTWTLAVGVLVGVTPTTRAHAPK